MKLKISDLICILIVLAVIAAFVFIEPLRNFYLDANSSSPFLTGFVKFAILATFGEMLALRIREGVYYKKGFGIGPRMIIWGILGMTIVGSMMIFKAGVPAMLNVIGVDDAAGILAGDLSISKVGVAFCVSVVMNIVYAPVMMTVHKITDMHIAKTGGTIKGFFTNWINFGETAQQINWKTQFNVVFFKTIPLFWFPMHTITFCLPGNLQVLFAALLSIALGIIMALVNLRGNKPSEPQKQEATSAA